MAEHIIHREREATGKNADGDNPRDLQVFIAAAFARVWLVRVASALPRVRMSPDQRPALPGGDFRFDDPA